MKAALISNLATSDFVANRKRILELAVRAVDKGAQLIVLPEAAATGLANTGKPEHDLELTEPVPGTLTREWRGFATERGVWLAAGLLEKAQGKIYDSYVLYDPEGNLALHYRRIDPHWRNPGDDPSVYCVGEDIPVIDTPFGRVGSLICGDMWDDAILERLKGQSPDYLLYPFLRSIEGTKDRRARWSRELGEYRKRWSETGASVLAVNLFEGKARDASIGGAWYVGAGGRIVNSLPILKEGILFAELRAG